MSITDDPTKHVTHSHQQVVRPCACGARCALEGADEAEPCWGQVNIEYSEEYEEDGIREEVPIHACEGHSPKMNGGSYDGQYLKWPNDPSSATGADNNPKYIKPYDRNQTHHRR